MKHIVSFSGGKDSTAMLLMMIDRKMQIDEIVFGDTMLEFPEMYSYIEKIATQIDRPIKMVSPKTTFFKWFYGTVTRGKHKGRMRGFPPMNAHCYWSREVKEYALKRYCYGQNVYLGIAVDEPHRLKDHPKFNAIYPLADWGITEADCMEFLKNKGLLNPLYADFDRLGCWLCPKQKKKSLKVLWGKYQFYWERLKVLESESPCGFNIKGLKNLQSEFEQADNANKIIE